LEYSQRLYVGKIVALGVELHHRIVSSQVQTPSLVKVMQTQLFSKRNLQKKHLRLLAEMRLASFVELVEVEVEGEALHERTWGQMIVVEVEVLHEQTWRQTVVEVLHEQAWGLVEQMMVEVLQMRTQKTSLKIYFLVG
jgi:hypothetical protein